MRVRTATQAGTGLAMRAGHAKTIAGITNAVLAVDRLLPAELAVGHFLPGAILPAMVRLSNASVLPQPDGAPDMRGLAMRLQLPGGGLHDLLLANARTCLARDAEQFFEFSMMAAGESETLLARLAERFGLEEGRRIAAYQRNSFRLCASLADECFWGGSAYLWGASPARIELRPLSSHGGSASTARSDDALRAELAARLLAGDVRYRFAIQSFVDEKRTPIEDAAVDWLQSVARPIDIATLIFPRQDIAGGAGAAAMRDVEAFSFDPWNAPPQFRPLGSLNRLRRLIYRLSADARRG